jgi:hypothetical protein
MADIVTIELGFGQQVAAEARKNFRKLSFRPEKSRRYRVPDSFNVMKIKF